MPRTLGRVTKQIIYIALNTEGGSVGAFTYGYCPDDGRYHVWDHNDPSMQAIGRYRTSYEAQRRARAEAEDLITVRERP